MTTPTVPSQRRPNPVTLQVRGWLAQRWQALQARERVLIVLATGLVLAALLWALAIAPAVALLGTADAQHTKLVAQLQAMQVLQTQAKALQGQPKMDTADAGQALALSVKQRLGANAQVSLAGTQATITVKAVPAAALAEWMTQARTAARAVPVKASLSRSNAAPGTWDGTLVLSLPAP